jgi:putative glutamine amidotransferase
MKKYLIFFFIIFLFTELSAQDFFRNEFDADRKYFLIANPTVRNIETIKFLLDNRLLRINSRKIHFVGVYYENQSYNFDAARQYIEKKKLTNFFLHEFRGDLDADRLFETNVFSDELKFVFENSAGIFFFGGPDIPPAVYGEENTLSVVTDPERHYFEVTFLFHLLGSHRNDGFEHFLKENPDYFVTGFCLGLQTMNVATGGTLIQDIPAEIYGATTPEETVKTGKENMHRNYWQKISDEPDLMNISFHTIQFTGHPFFRKKIRMPRNARPLVYSSHHQAVKKSGKNMEITALSADGKVVEGLAHSYYPHVFAVQFHPEVPALYEHRERLKFQPGDIPATYHQIVGKKGVKFHKKYWRYVSRAVKKAARN